MPFSIDNDYFVPFVDGKSTAVVEIDTVIHCINMKFSKEAHAVPVVFLVAT